MTDTTPAAVELLATELPDAQWQAPRLHRAADTLRALSAKLEAANARAEMLANALATARADAMKEAVRRSVALCENAAWLLSVPQDGSVPDQNKMAWEQCFDLRDAILALIPASPAEPAQTVQEAAKDALMVEHIDIVSDACRKFKLSEPNFRAALRAIAGGRDE